MTTLTLSAAEPGILTVVLMGLGTVFVGILTIIIVCKLMSLLDRPKKAAEAAKPAEEYIKPDGELAAVLGAVIAEETGEDVKNIKIVSVKKV